jgi:hypothetical protein
MSANETSSADVCRLTASRVCRAFGRPPGLQRLMQALCVQCAWSCSEVHPGVGRTRSLPPRKAGARSAPVRTTACRPQQASAQCQWRRPHRWKASAPVSVPRPRPALGAERCPPGWWPGGRAGVWLGRLLEQTRSGAGASRPAERVGERDRRARRARALMPVRPWRAPSPAWRRRGWAAQARRLAGGWLSRPVREPGREGGGGEGVEGRCRLTVGGDLL